jgi:hypothetical protein
LQLVSVGSRSRQPNWVISREEDANACDFLVRMGLQKLVAQLLGLFHLIAA